MNVIASPPFDMLDLKSRNDDNSLELIDIYEQMIDNFFKLIDNHRQRLITLSK